MISKDDPKIVYSKPNVYFKDVAGSLTIMDKTHDYYIGWFPEQKESFIQVDYQEKGRISHQVSFSENNDEFSYASQSILSFTLTPKQIIFQLQTGKKIGPLFHDGLHDFLEKLSRLVLVRKSSPDVYLVGQEPFDPVNTLKEARWSLLEKFSQVTQLSRKAVRLFQTEQEPAPSQNLEYDSARLFLAKWAAGLAEESERNSAYKQIGVWGHEETSCGLFEILSHDSFSHTRTSPISSEEWSSWFNPDGQLKEDVSVIRQRIFCGGVDPKIRKDVWMMLTYVYDWDSTSQERREINDKKKKEYERLKSQWMEQQQQPSFKDQRHRIEKDVHRTDRTIDLYTSEIHLEALKSILCTYNTYNPTLGYVQGMSDLLSPLYAITQEEYLAFWAFVGVMNRMKSNFYKDQSGMHRQLVMMDHLLQFMDYSLYAHLQRTDNGNFFFCFRWLLVLYKREFAWDDMLKLWEVLWTDQLTDKFHLFIALAILDKHRDHIMTYLKNFDEVLKYINDLSMNLNLQDILQRAEVLFYQFKQRMEVVDDKRKQLQKMLKESADEQKKEVQADLNRLPNQDTALRELL
ncbi:rab-GTPase-TBC domain-containing protein [Sporodiniella umbellata]|nr:rab-GTPase-TBC domain-containing protein [Sporodiniella umbellata]